MQGSVAAVEDPTEEHRDVRQLPYTGQHLQIVPKPPQDIGSEANAGHGAGKPIDKIIADTADMRAFAAQRTGLDARAATPGA